jgi:hypothetical protein
MAAHQAQRSEHLPLLVQLRKDTYTRLTPVQRLQVARHPNRPTFLDIALNISDKFVELHGDRAGLDDPAMVCGLASIDGVSFMFIGHQKGRNTKVRSLKFNCCMHAIFLHVPSLKWTTFQRADHLVSFASILSRSSDTCCDDSCSSRSCQQLLAIP